MSAARNKIREIIQDAYSSKKSANKTLREVHKVTENDDDWQDEEAEYDEGEEDEDGEEDEGEDEDEDEDEGGGLLGAILDILPNDDDYEDEE